MDISKTLPRDEDASTSIPEMSSFTCRECYDSPSQNARNIVVCIDGTSNKFDQHTNVVKLFAMVDLKARNPEQHAYYISGVGTTPKPLHKLKGRERTFGDIFAMAFGRDIERHVVDAYSWLARTYRVGDRIYLFGFSRGAYQIRLLAEMIYEVGLIKVATDDQIGSAYDHYDAIRSKKPNSKQSAKEFKDMFSWKDLKKVHFVGVWDTVSSEGLIRKDVFLSSSASGEHACHFRHALALDECRVKFMPEYFREINQMYGRKRKNYSINEQQPPDVGKGCDDNVKEVWFAGSHSDVGGTKQLGQSYRAGNVSLLWMRREAADHGLALLPTDIVWVPGDLDFGTSDSMTLGWSLLEHLPIKHQTSFAGVGGYSRRLHLMSGRRIIPGQRVHTSILCVNNYTPRARLGRGFDIPMTQAKSGDTVLDENFWENGVYDPSAVKELLDRLHHEQGITSAHLDGLLWMLRSREGKRNIRSVPDWKDQLKNLMKPNNPPPVKLVALILYREVYDPAEGEEHPREELQDGKSWFKEIINQDRHDRPGAFTFLRPLTMHPKLREHILTSDVIDLLLEPLDAIIEQPEGIFEQAMDGLCSLLQCEDTRERVAEKLKERPQNRGKSRIYYILDADIVVWHKYRQENLFCFRRRGRHHSAYLSAALCVTFAFARVLGVSPAKPSQKVEEASDEAKQKVEKQKVTTVEVWSELEPKIKMLARSSYYSSSIRSLAINIWLTMSDQAGLDLSLLGRSTLAEVAVPLERFKDAERESPNENGRGGTPEQQLHELFETTLRHRPQSGAKLALEFLSRKGYNLMLKDRDEALTLLKLCETKAISTHERKTELLDCLIYWLRFKPTALLAAQALVICLKDEGMREHIVHHKCTPKHIIIMILHNYFDDAVGTVEGFQIFRDLMRHGNPSVLEIECCKIAQILDEKFKKGKYRDTRTGLICLDIFLSYDTDQSLAQELVKRSLKYLRSDKWDIQKAGIRVLYALTQIEKGVEVIKASIKDIIGLLVQDAERASRRGPVDSASANVPLYDLVRPIIRVEQQKLRALSYVASMKPWRMMGPACALWALARNETLRECIRNAPECTNLKKLYSKETFARGWSLNLWWVNAPNKPEVTRMLENMFKAVEQGTSLRDLALPRISHWGRFAARLSAGLAILISAPILGVGLWALALAAEIAFLPIGVAFYVVFLVLSIMLTIPMGIFLAHASQRVDDLLQDSQPAGGVADDLLHGSQPAGGVAQVERNSGNCLGTFKRLFSRLALNRR